MSKYFPTLSNFISIVLKNVSKEKPLNIQRLEILLDPSKEKERAIQKENAINDYYQKFGNLDSEKAYKAMFDLLWYTQLPCSDVRGYTSDVKDELSFIKRCYWKDTPIVCSAIFHKQPTDRGMCCSFNMEKAEQLLKRSKYRDVIMARQKYDSEHGFDPSKKPQWFLDKNEPTPTVGVKNGLSLVFDAHSDRLSKLSVIDDFHGVPLLIEDRDRFPMVERSGIEAMPGFRTKIKVNAFEIQANEEIKRHGPMKRKCYFPDEYDLNIHENYSHSSCIFECKIEFAAKCLSTCIGFKQPCDCSNANEINAIDLKSSNSCVPWYYPRNDEGVNKFCDPWATKKFNEIFNGKMSQNQCDHCLDDCTSTVYDSVVSYSKLPACDSTNAVSPFCGIIDGEINPPPWIKDAQNEFLTANQSIPSYLGTGLAQRTGTAAKFSSQRSRLRGESVETQEIFATKLKMNPSYNAFEKDIGIVSVFFAKEQVPKYVKTNRWNIFDFLSQIGGSLGLFMGISVISVAEVFYWLVFRFLGKVLSTD